LKILESNKEELGKNVEKHWATQWATLAHTLPCIWYYCYN